MKTMKAILAFAILLISITAVSALPINLNSVEIDNTELNVNEVNRLSVERGQEVEVIIRFTPTADIRDAEVRAFISGYEYSDVKDIEDETPVFDADQNVTYVKKLSIVIPDDVDQDDYKLRVIITDRFNDDEIYNFNLKIDIPRNAVQIKDVILNPAHSIKAGSALLATVRVENKGEKTQEDVKVTVSIPALGVSGTAYIDEIDNNDDEEQTEEIFIRLPSCAKADTYDVITDVEYSNNNRKTTAKDTITVTADDTCNQGKAQTTITMGSQVQSIEAGQTAIFPVSIVNTGKTSKSYTISIQDQSWAITTITPSNVLVIPAGETQTAFINVQAAENTPAGAHSLMAMVTSGDKTTELTLTANVAQTTGATRAFEIILIVLVAGLVILGAILGIGYLRNREPETYY